jgi:hypothetical protein
VQAPARSRLYEPATAPGCAVLSLVRFQSQSQIKTALFRTVFIWLADSFGNITGDDIDCDASALQYLLDTKEEDEG